MLEDPIHQLRIVPPEEAPQNGKIRVKLISPLKEVFQMEADKVLLPAVDGDILILPDRAPIFISLKAGRMVIYNKGQENINYLISAGICEVRRNLCPVLAWGVEESKLQLDHVKKELSKARVICKDNASYMQKKEVSTRVDFFKRILELSGEAEGIDLSEGDVPECENLTDNP